MLKHQRKYGFFLLIQLILFFYFSKPPHATQHKQLLWVVQMRFSCPVLPSLHVFTDDECEVMDAFFKHKHQRINSVQYDTKACLLKHRLSITTFDAQIRASALSGIHLKSSRAVNHPVFVDDFALIWNNYGIGHLDAREETIYRFVCE